MSFDDFEIVDLDHAELVLKNVVMKIQEFEAHLPDTMQAGYYVPGAPGAVMVIDKVSCMSPDIITFSGQLSPGHNAVLVQHITQLNLLLVAAPRTDDTSLPRRTIGFQPPKAGQSQP